eukprot:8673429-Ditylum_brightwellii.AAC.1
MSGLVAQFEYEDEPSFRARNELDASMAMSMATIPISNLSDNGTYPSPPRAATISSSSSVASPTSIDPPEPSPPRQGKKLSVFSALFGECLCADGFLGAAANSGAGKRPAAQFIKLDGIECIALGAVADEQTARQR